jgi:hypothetical protein
MRTEKKPVVGRRDFLRALSAGALGASAAAGSNALPALADSESSDEKRKARYTESDHVKTYYRVNRYPQSR